MEFLVGIHLVFESLKLGICGVEENDKVFLVGDRSLSLRSKTLTHSLFHTLILSTELRFGPVASILTKIFPILTHLLLHNADHFVGIGAIQATLICQVTHHDKDKTFHWVMVVVVMATVSTRSVVSVVMRVAFLIADFFVSVMVMAMMRLELRGLIAE